MSELKVALVTGAASGMGRISSKRVAADGVHVAAVDVNEKGFSELKPESNNISTFPCDLSDSNAVKSMVQQVQSEVGSIDRVTNAGAIMPLGRVADLSAESINQLMRINYEGTVNIVANVLPQMIERDSGQIILFGSIAGTCPVEHMSAYSASKAAVNMYGEILAKELEDTVSKKKDNITSPDGDKKRITPLTPKGNPLPRNMENLFSGEAASVKNVYQYISDEDKQTFRDFQKNQ